jgi:hypothetical protein
VSPKHLTRLLTRYIREGESGLDHKAKGKPSNNRKPQEVREKLSELIKSDYIDMGPSLISDIYSEDYGVALSRETIRGWMTKEKTWEPKAEKPKHRRSRPRRSCYGELVQMDTSEHLWLGPDQPMVQLIAMIDDATQQVHMKFYAADSTESNMDCILGYIRKYGLPRAIYTDRASHFSYNPSEKHGKGSSKEGQDEATTQIERALKECGIQHIKAYSPQAKGRIERAFGVLQDRLLHRLRLAGITTIEEANEFLEKVYIPKWNKRFGRKPAKDFNAHMSIGNLNLNAIFSVQLTRVVLNNYTISLHGRKFQIEAMSVVPGLKRGKVTVEKRLDGEIKIKFKDQYLYMHEILGR